MSKLEIAKNIIKKHVGHAQCGIFDCRNFAGDIMNTIYNANGLVV